MQTSTIATLQQIQLIPWFSQVGQDMGEDVVICSSWDQALKQAGEIHWRNHKLEKANDLRENLMLKDRQRFQRWNDVAAELRAALESEILPKVRAYQQAHGLPDLLIHSVQWDMLHVLLEAEYSDVIPVGFYAGNAFWYLQGHFPCGWQMKDSKSLPRVY